MTTAGFVQVNTFRSDFENDATACQKPYFNIVILTVVVARWPDGPAIWGLDRSDSENFEVACLINAWGSGSSCCCCCCAFLYRKRHKGVGRKNRWHMRMCALHGSTLQICSSAARR